MMEKKKSLSQLNILNVFELNVFESSSYLSPNVDLSVEGYFTGISYQYNLTTIIIILKSLTAIQQVMG